MLVPRGGAMVPAALPCADCRLPVLPPFQCGHKASSSIRFVAEHRRTLQSFSSKSHCTRISKPRMCFPNAIRLRFGNCNRSFTPQASDNDGAESVQEQDGEEQRSEGDREQPSLITLQEAIVLGTRRYIREFNLDLQREAAVELDFLRKACDAIVAYFERRRQELAPQLLVLRTKFGDYSMRTVEILNLVRMQLWPQFVSWNRWALWKDIKRWDAQRIGALAMYVLVVAASVRGLHTVFFRARVVNQLANAYMEAVIPDPTAFNVKKLRKAMWRWKMPRGFGMKRYVYGDDGEFHHDKSFIGENAWDEGRDEEFPSNVDELIEKNPDLTQERKEQLKGLASAIFNMYRRKREEARAKKSWQDRLEEWDRILKTEELKDILLSRKSKFALDMDWDEVNRGYLERSEREEEPRPPTAFVMMRKWWQYRPKLPYTYFLSKLHKSEVEAAVYTEDARKLFVKMKEGFPAEYTVDIPVDPYLYDTLKACNVEVDMMQRSSWYYYLRALAVLAPSLLIIFYIRRFTLRALTMSAEKIIDLLKMDRKHLILPEDAAQKAQSEYKDVVIGGNVWEVLEEIMAYMREPMRYFNKGVLLPRGILISGPPGTGKTLLARAIARESGLPFVFASGAEFVESSTGDGAQKVFNIFFTARANAPSFIFIDEIDSLAGKGVNDDPERRSTFDQLISELDGLPEDTDVDRYSLRQAVVLICATNRPDELDDRFLRPGRIDREIHIGLPGEEQRLGIFGVHSAGRRLANDVDFSKLVFRTVGYSGADIRNLINEAGIMAVRKGRVEICQQDFVNVLDKQLFEGLGMSMTEEEQAHAEDKVSVETKRLLAVHEAGHIVLAHLFPRYDWHALTHLLPGGKESALSLYYPREEMIGKGYTTVGYLKMQMVVAHGGRCAEHIVFGGDITDGGQDDLARISKIAREIAISNASPRLGLFPFVWRENLEHPLPPDGSELVPNNWNKPGNRIANMSMELSELFTREVTRYADETEEQAMRGLLMNRHILDRISVELLNRTMISGLEIGEMIKSMNPVLFPDPMEIPDLDSDDVEQSDISSRRGRYEELDIYQAPLPSF